MAKERSTGELVQMIEEVRGLVRRHTGRHEERPTIAGQLAEVKEYALRTPAVPALVKMHLQEAVHLFTGHQHGATDRVGRCLTSALEHLAPEPTDDPNQRGVA